MTADLRPLLVIHVPGKPRPKGSLRHVGHGRLIEQLDGSPDWRRAVATTAVEAGHKGCVDDPRALARLPYTGAVKVTIVLELPKAAKPRDPHFPSGRNTGDVDKHARNILDAIVDAGVIKDDSQVVDLAVSKRYTTFAPGAHITVWPAAAAQIELPASPPGGPPHRSAPPGGGEWSVDHPGIGILPYPDQAAAEAAAGTAGTVIHTPERTQLCQE